MRGPFAKSEEKKDTPTGERTTLSTPLFMADSMSAGTSGSTDDKFRVSRPSSALTIAAHPLSVLRGNAIEEVVNKWSSDLEVQVKEFSKFATEVAVWDRALIENGNSVSLRSATPSLSFSRWLVWLRLHI